jgi:hypothetical protein
MQNLLNLYENELGAVGFYNVLANEIQNSPNLYNKKGIFLGDLLAQKKVLSDQIKPIVNKGDTRIDMPILSGDVNSKERILILGLEPRHTNDFYNIMKVSNKVFATPFGIDRWYSDSKQSIYASAFEKFSKNDRIFLFSDFVKEYVVTDPNQKSINDQNARQNFEKLFNEKYKSLLEEEIEIFKPKIIIGLGKTDISKKVPKSWIEKYNVNIIAHPTNGNYAKMQKAMTELLK